MRIVVADDSIPDIGYQGENNRTWVEFPIADIMEEFPGGMATVLIQRKGDDRPYPAAVTEMEGTTLVWTVQSYDIAIEGFLKAQLIYTVDETIAKRKVYRLNVGESLTDETVEPPDWEDWVQGLLEAGANVHGEIEEVESTLADMVIDAEAYARSAQQDADSAYQSKNASEASETNARRDALRAEGYATGTQDGSAVGPGSPYYGNNAMEYADSARRSEESATEAKNIAVGMVSTMTAEAETLSPDAPATAALDHSGAHSVLRIGIPKGDTGSSGVYYGTTEPTDPAINVWIDPSGVSNIETASGVSF